MALTLSSMMLGATLLLNPNPVQSKEGTHPGLARQLAKMVNVDQDVRNELVKASNTPGSKELPSIIRRMEEIDRYTTNQMRQIVTTYGWPTVKLVGKQGANDAWLLVQHADLNPRFQRVCLNLMEPLVTAGEVAKQNFAYLTDRVLIAEGKKQIYGTQFKKGSNGEWEPQPMEDPDNVDKRRQSMGMSTLAEYRKMLEEFYGKKPPK